MGLAMPPGVSGRRFTRWTALWIIAAGVVLLLVGEGAARIVVGTPVVYVAHPTIEYLQAPNQDVVRFGNHIVVNQWGMRGPPVEVTKTVPGEFRVLALGDSVLNGGAPTDQRDLATTILSIGHTSVLNASAGSWGPANMLAYVNEYGVFDSDMTVIVVSTHDAADVPGFGPLDPATHPTSVPWSVLFDTIMRYAPRLLPGVTPPTAPELVAAGGQEGGEGALAALPAFEALLKAARARGPVCVVLHSTRSEIAAGPASSRQYQALAEASARNGAAVVADAPIMDPATDYRDDIHPNARGQVALAEAIRQCSDRF